MTIALLKPNAELKSDTTEESFRPLIQPGEYLAQCIAFKEFKQFGGLKKLALTWDLTLSGMEGVRLAQYFNMEHQTFKENSFYYENWVVANNCTRPRRRNRAYMPPTMFTNIVGAVLVVTVSPKFENGKPKPEVFHYSKVQRLLSLSVPNNRRGQ
jgi:hypothetical protein